MRIAVVGSGASAYSVLKRLQTHSVPQRIDVYERGAFLDAPMRPRDQDYRAVYAAQKRDHGLHFPPPKSHFGAPVDSRPDALLAGSNHHVGGLTNFWGGTCLAMTDAELSRLGLASDTLQPYYTFIAGQLGIAGSGPYASRPAPEVLQHMQMLERTVNASDSRDADSGWRHSARGNPVALDTLTASDSSCTYCGQCLAGCYRKALFCSADYFARLHAEQRIQLCTATVEAIEAERRTVVYRRHGERHHSKPYDLIFVAAGGPGSAEIMLRSIPGLHELTLYDNAILQFPILLLQKSPSYSADYFGLSQAIISCNSGNDVTQDGQVQVYPFSDYLIRAAVPERSWSMLAPLAKTLRGHVLLARLYLHSAHSHQYKMRLSGAAVQLHSSQGPNRALARQIIKSLARKLSGSGFWIPPLPPIATRTSSHFASSLTRAEASPVSAGDGAAAPGVYVCDASVFPESPATSPTFTIMANAARITDIAMQAAGSGVSA